MIRADHTHALWVTMPGCRQNLKMHIFEGYLIFIQYGCIHRDRYVLMSCSILYPIVFYYIILCDILLYMFKYLHFIMP